jgi:hypothetical protein
MGNSKKKKTELVKGAGASPAAGSATAPGITSDGPPGGVSTTDAGGGVSTDDNNGGISSGGGGVGSD